MPGRAIPVVDDVSVDVSAHLAVFEEEPLLKEELEGHKPPVLFPEDMRLLLVEEGVVRGEDRFDLALGRMRWLRSVACAIEKVVVVVGIVEVRRMVEDSDA